MTKDRMQQIAEEAMERMWNDYGIFTQKELKEFSKFLYKAIENKSRILSHRCRTQEAGKTNLT